MYCHGTVCLTTSLARLPENWKAAEGNITDTFSLFYFLFIKFI
jgi:hypothetical protein